jgi:YVTN family beta-propeller protein
MRLAFGVFCLGSALVAGLAAQDTGAPPPPAAKKGGGRRPKPGVSTAGVKRDMSTITPAAVFAIEGTPDWQVLTADAVWVANGPKNTIHRLDPATNTVVATVEVGKKPCSGLTEGFGSIWVPNCTDKTISRVDEKTNQVVATVPVGPAQSEGGITTGAGSVWIVSDRLGKLSRIDPKENKVTAEIAVPANSAACLFAEGAVWITTPERGMLTRVDAASNQVTDSIAVGPQPRFLTAGAGAIWTLNQGDGTVSRVDAATRKVAATIEVGIPGTGGEIAFGNGHVWATVFTIPLSEIDPATNQVVRQWVGAGGDSVRVGHGSVWLSNLQAQNVWRIDLNKF